MTANEADQDISNNTATVTYTVGGLVTVDVPLAAGFNLIGIPLQLPESTTAKDIAEQIAGQGGAVSSILTWNAGYEAWLADFPDEKNFLIELRLMIVFFDV